VSNAKILKTALVIPDCHIPFESKLYDVMLKISSLVDIHEVVILGDYLDLYGLSFYDQNPDLGDMADLYDREIECGNHRLDEIDQLFNKAKKVYLEGNHEYRIKKFLSKNAKALRNRISIPEELSLSKRGKWSWVPFTKLQTHSVLGSNLQARHCPPVGGSTENVAKQSGDSVIYGHTHQFGVGTFVAKMTGKVTTAINGGWLGNGAESVFDYVQNRPNWSHAFVLVHYNGKDWWHEAILFNGSTAVFRGKEYK